MEYEKKTEVSLTSKMWSEELSKNWCHLLRGRLLFFLLTFFLLLFKYSFLPFPSCPPDLPRPPLLLLLFPPLPPCHCPWVLYNCSCKPITLFPHYPPTSPLWSLSPCSQFQCLWLCFACLFIFLIRFLLKVRSYGNCLSLPGLFYLALLSSSIHAVAKGRSSFFLSAA